MSTNGLFSPLEDTPFVIAPGFERGANCFSQVIGLIGIKPKWKIILGSVLLYCQDDLQESAPSYWQRPWVQHAWLIDENGKIHDPAIRNLEFWAEAAACTLPCPVEDMKAIIIKRDENQKENLSKLINSPFNQKPAHELAYLPGLIFTQSIDTTKMTDVELNAWGGAASFSEKKGGLNEQQFIKAMEKIDEYIEFYSPKKSKAGKRFKGFGMVSNK